MSLLTGRTPFRTSDPGGSVRGGRNSVLDGFELLTARRHQRLAGVLPLARRRRSLRSPTNWHTPLFGLLAEDQPAASALSQFLFEQRPSSAHLAFLDSSGPDIGTLRSAAAAAGYRTLERVFLRSPYVRIEGPWEVYQSTLSRNLRGDVARRKRRLEETGSVAIDVTDGADSLESRLDEGLAIEGSGWKQDGGTAVVSEPGTLRFYRSVATWAAERGYLRLAFLRLDGQAIAFLFDFETGGAHYYIKGGYDPAFSRFSPAKLLLHGMVERAFALGLERFEFLGSDDPYKLQLANATRVLEVFDAFSQSPAGLVAYAETAYARPLARRVLRRERR